MEWYNDYDHVGYDTMGKKILKPEVGDKIDEFLDRMENPEFGLVLTVPFKNNLIMSVDIL